MVGLLRPELSRPLGVLGERGEPTLDVPVPPETADRALPSAEHRLMGLAMRLVTGRDLRLEVAVLGLNDLVVVLAMVLDVARAAELLAGRSSWAARYGCPAVKASRILIDWPSCSSRSLSARRSRCRDRVSRLRRPIRPRGVLPAFATCRPGDWTNGARGGPFGPRPASVARCRRDAPAELAPWSVRCSDSPAAHSAGDRPRVTLAAARRRPCARLRVQPPGSGTTPSCCIRPRSSRSDQCSTILPAVMR